MNRAQAPRLGAASVGKRLVKRSVALTCAGYCALNYRDGRRFARGNIETGSGTLHDSLDLAGSCRYVGDVFDEYKRYGGITRFTGRVAEIGPGDNCGVAMLIAADGAERVDLVDRFFSRRDAERQAAVYETLLRERPAVAARFAGVDPRDERTFTGIVRHYGPRAAAEVFFREHGDYDFIISRAVMEHLYDPIAALGDMAAALRPGGVMLHKVDFRDHGMFTPQFDELKFLEIPAWLYRRMTLASGRPNRVLLHEYRAAMADTGLAFELLVTSLAGVGPIEPHCSFEALPAAVRDRALRFVAERRARFAAPLRDVDPADLAVTGLFLVARRAPGAPT